MLHRAAPLAEAAAGIGTASAGTGTLLIALAATDWSSIFTGVGMVCAGVFFVLRLVWKFADERRASMDQLKDIGKQVEGISEQLRDRDQADRAWRSAIEARITHVENEL